MYWSIKYDEVDSSEYIACLRNSDLLLLSVTDSDVDMLMLGLGGGGLPLYIHKHFPKVRHSWDLIIVEQA